MSPSTEQRDILLFVVNETYFFMSHRLALARAAAAAGYEIHVAGPSDHVWAPPDFEVGVLERSGFSYHEVPLSRRGMNPFRDLATLLALWRLFRRLRPKIVHNLTIKPVLYGGIAARLAGVPCLVSTITGLGHAFSSSGARAAMLRRLITLLYQLALAHPRSHTIVQNREDLDRLVGLRATRSDRTTLIPGSGADLRRFAPRPEAAGPGVVVLPARLIWDKGVAVFVEAARRLRAEGVEARFALVGDTQPSNPRSVPKEQLAAWQQAGEIEWWGRRDDMPDVFAMCHVVCLPTGYGEGVPKALIEAAACGRPIVATDIAGCREIVGDGDNGLLVPAADAAALAGALRRLLEDDDLRRRMGQRGREIAQQGFDEETMAGAIVALYDALRGAAARPA